MEALIEKPGEKIVERTQTPIEKFWDNLEKTTEVVMPDNVKRKEAIVSFWDDLVSDGDNSIEAIDKTEQIEKLRHEYIDDLKNNSEYPDTIGDNGEVYKKLSPEETAEKRVEFNVNKEKLIKEWEENNGKEWPRYKDDVYVNGKLIRNAGDRYDAHHIHPLSLDGKNEASNITPIRAEKHFDKQGVHAPDSPYGKLEKTLQEAIV